MLLDYYGLREQPFQLCPDSRYLFPSETHREALASLLYGIEAGCGFMALIAEPGLGKTTLLVRTLSQLHGRMRTAFVFQSISSREEFLRAVLQDLGIRDVRGDLGELQARLVDLLLEIASRGERLVIIVDEAQNLASSILEFVRMLSNFEATQRKLMHIVLCGQPGLAHKLMTPGLSQLRQRIATVARLRPLTEEETERYIAHRLRLAGNQTKARLFTPGALRTIVTCCEGIPRKINIVCLNALSLGYATKRKVIDSDVVREVVADLELETRPSPPRPPVGTRPESESSKRHRHRLFSRAIGKAASITALLFVLLSLLAPCGPDGSNVVLSSATPSAVSFPRHAVLRNRNFPVPSYKTLHVQDREATSRAFSFPRHSVLRIRNGPVRSHKTRHFQHKEIFLAAH